MARIGRIIGLQLFQRIVKYEDKLLESMMFTEHTIGRGFASGLTEIGSEGEQMMRSPVPRRR
ncbi:MAG: hypothetical protein EBZ36_17095 [Acidobacteria bacterium]|jgi:hypothetical protein|nr:hypothetical protein [Acidobacteriota bacterium]